jgi:replicative DNA helicase
MTRLLPIDAERAVLGCILSAASYSADAGVRVANRIHGAGLGPEHFSLEANAELYRVILRLAEAGVPVDAISISAEIDREHADPHLIDRLRVLAHEVPAIGAADRYARIVVDAALLREIETRRAA